MSENKDRSMFEHTTRLVSENLARAVNRRTFLKRASQTAFAGLATLAAGQALSGRASAAHRPDGKPETPFISCSPPGPYCNTGGGNLSGCHGAHCFQHLYNNQVLQCHVYYGYYPTGCWTNGSWVCCDCSCGSPQATTCGCAQQTGFPTPSPDRPGLLPTN